MPHLVDELAERHAIEAHALGVRLDADLIGTPASDVGEADVLELGELDAQVLGDGKEIARLIAARRLGLG